MNDPRPVILFDGDCNFCNTAARRTAERDKHRRLHFARLQSPAARRIITFADPGIDFEALPDSMVFVDEDGIYTASTAALHIARYLRFPWPVFAVALAVPRFLRDPVYRFLPVTAVVGSAQALRARRLRRILLPASSKRRKT